MNIKIINYTFHCMAYYLAWFSAIFFASNNHNSAAVLIVMVTVILQAIWQRYISRRTQGLWVMMLLFVASGTLADTFLIQVGLIQLSANPFGNSFTAPWMSSLWLSFAITFYSILPSFFERYLLVSILSLISFPIAYATGAALHAAQLPHGYSSSLVIGMIWAILFPLILKIYHAIE
jgi:hypothetical protein